LEKVRQRKVNLAPGGDTALSNLTATSKRREIAKRLERMARELGNDPLEIGEVKTDENFAAVIVRKVGGFDPGRLRVFAVALVKKQSGEWSAAPLPASFENSGAGYAPGSRQRLEQLENWMLREQVENLESLREQSASQMRQKIEVNLPTARLRSYSAGEVGEQFLAACGRRDLPAVLGFLGGLAAKLPDDWSQRLKAADHALAAGRDVTRPWRLLLSRDVAKVLVHHEEEQDRGLLSYACLDPQGAGHGTPRIEVVHFDLSKTDGGLWQINPDAEFLELGDGDPEVATESELDQDLVDAFPSKWSAAHPPSSHPTAEQAYQSLTAALHSGDLAALLKISKLDGSPQRAVKACTQAAATWWENHASASIRYALPLALKADETTAIALYQFFSARDPEQLDLKSFHFEKSASGWSWAPQPDAALTQEQQDWLAAETHRWPSQWQAKLLETVPECPKGGESPAPADQAARACVESWLAAAKQGNVKLALPWFTRLGELQSASIAFQNLGYEINGARLWEGEPAIVGVYRGKTWTAVGVKIAQKDGKLLFPLYPLIETASGPRIMAEISLILPENRTRKFLNNQALERLGKHATEASANDLRELLDTFNAQISQKAAPADP
jgi:hypothetical protein